MVEGKLNSKISISFDTNGGNDIESKEIPYRSLLKIDNPVKKGFKFKCWKYNDDVIDVNTYIFTKSVTLTAEWNDIRISVNSLYLLEEEDSYTVLGLNEDYTSNIKIPNIYDGKPVTSISSGAFKKIKDIESIIFGINITTIESGAFDGCEALQILYFEGNENDWHSNNFIDQFFNLNIYYYSVDEPDSIGNYWCYDTDGTTPVIWGDLAYRLENDEYVVTGIGTYKDTDVIIPEIYKGKKVTSIEENAFSNCSNLISVIVPDSVTSIGISTFYGCSNLTSITLPFIGDKFENSNSSYFGYIFGAINVSFNGSSIPKSLKNVVITKTISIGAGAFYGCSNLTSIVIPNGVTSINALTFYNCSSLRSIELPNSVTTIESSAFCGCSSLTSIVIPNGVASINAQAFYNCSSLRSIELPNSVITIETTAFYGCSSLTSIVVDENNTVYDSRNSCNAIIETATNTLIQGCKNTIIPSSVTSIGSYAFYGSSSLTNVEIPSGVTSIGSYAFSNCSSLINVEIPNSVKSIGEYVFSGCSSLTSIAIPNTVTSINKYAFSGCSSLTSIAIPNTVTSINKYAFSGCSSLTSIIIPDSVTSIKGSAFVGCSDLKQVYYFGTFEQWKSISIPTDNNNLISATRYYYSDVEPVDTDNLYWHYDSDGITPVIWPSPSQGLSYTLNGKSYEVTGIGECTDTDIIIPSVYENLPVTSIAANAFNNCSSLVSINIPDSILSIGDSAFYDCINLKSIKLPKNLNYLGPYVFSYCYKLSDINIPSSLTVIKNDTFYECRSLTNITIPNNIVTIEKQAFRCCSGLISITIPSSVTEIGDSAFYYCLKLKSIHIPNSIVELKTQSFGYCETLMDVIIENNLSTISEDLFVGCDDLKNIYFVGTRDEWDNKTFKNNKYLQNVTCYYYSEIEKDDDEYSYWHYESDGITPTKWPSYSKGLAYTLIDGKYEVSGIGSCTDCDIVIPSVYNNLPVTSIGEDAFNGCKRLTSVEIPDGVTNVGTRAFYDCDKLNSVNLPNSVIEIGNYAFYNCRSLTNISVSNNVNKISLASFCDCVSLQFVILSTKITKIESAFSGCNKLKSVYYLGTTEQWKSISIDSNGNNNDSLTSATIYYLSETQPTDTTYKYWHYVDGVPTKW